MKKTKLAIIVILVFLSISTTSFASNIQSIRLRIKGMTCSLCPLAVKKSILQVKGVISAQVSDKTNYALVKFDADLTDSGSIVNAVMDAGYGAKKQPYK